MREPSFLEEEMARQAWAITETARTVTEQLRSADLRAVTRTVLTGCGDSWFAARLCQLIAQDAGAREVSAIEALEFSRYDYRTLDEQSVVVALSYSGETVRAYEAAVAARSRGARVVAVTRDPTSPLGRQADLVVTYPDLAEQSNTRTMSFQAAVVALVTLLRSMGVLPRSTTDPDPWSEVAGWVDDGLVLGRGTVGEFATRCAGPGMEPPRLLGAGPGLVAAQYGAAKLYETATIAAYDVELEEFCHRDIFAVGPATPIVLLAPNGPAGDRLVEVEEALRLLGAPVLSITNLLQIGAETPARVPLPDRMDEMYTPLVAAPALQYLALDLARAKGEDPDLVRNKAVNSPLIRQCRAWSEDDYRSGAGRHGPRGRA